MPPEYRGESATGFLGFGNLRDRPVCTENLNPDVVVMKSAEYRV